MIWGKEYQWVDRSFILLQSHYGSIYGPKRFIMTQMHPGEILTFGGFLWNYGIRALGPHGEVLVLKPETYKIKWELLIDT